MRNVPIVLFPQGDPNTIYVYMKLPSGTDVKYTDSVTQSLERKINQVLGIDNGKKNPLVESVIANVAVGASDPNSGDRSTRPELGRIQVNHTWMQFARPSKEYHQLRSVLHRKVMVHLQRVQLTLK
jgi:multidrug efflux pump subunit AcrB